MAPEVQLAVRQVRLARGCSTHILNLTSGLERKCSDPRTRQPVRRHQTQEATPRSFGGAWNWQQHDASSLYPPQPSYQHRARTIIARADCHSRPPRPQIHRRKIRPHLCTRGAGPRQVVSRNFSYKSYFKFCTRVLNSELQIASGKDEELPLTWDRALI